jgi:uncharacterized protein YkwD
MTVWRALVAAVLIYPAGAAGAELRDSVNWARLQGCRGAGNRAPLADNAELGNAARRMADGQSLHAALAASGYLAAQSSAAHLSGAVSDAEVRRILAARYCATLTDPDLRDVGVLRHGHDVWLVFAAPVSLPGDAMLVSREILKLVNEARASGRRCGKEAYPAAAPLTLNRALSAAALAHSRQMAAFTAFDHRGHDGSTPAVRVERAGYGSYLVVGENIAAGAMTPAQVTEGWLTSPAHCENIMDARFKEIGIAYAVNLSSNELVYWTEDFAAPRPSPTGRR